MKAQGAALAMAAALVSIGAGGLRAQPAGAKKSSFAPSGKEPARTYVLRPGCYEKIIIDDGEQWIGIYPGKINDVGDAPAPSVASACKVRVKMVKNPAEGLEPAMVKKVTSDPPGALFLVKGNPAIKTGRLETAFVAHPEAQTTEDVDGKIEKQVFSLKAEERSSDEASSTVLVLSSVGVGSQDIASCGSRDSLAPIWVGDLDQDGKADVYSEVSHHNFLVEEHLHLSLDAGTTKEPLVRRAASFKARRFEE